ncbi:hypothetical protein ID875_21490 [Streptomyces globisporus]|uniref:DUF2637 domain-containing protein n=1 Tax=Streptomyces globisporus TaxID=1908 RepID=A0A927GP07_STRGL|nr:hypothetical protein [Streptomyces globisporus]
MSVALKFRRGIQDDWTAADFDSYTVLAELGVTRPAARVTRARRSRPLRRAVRAALRTITPHPTPEPGRRRKEAHPMTAAPEEKPAISWAEQSAKADAIRAETDLAREREDEERRRREALDAPEIAKAQARAEAVDRKAREDREAEDRARVERREAEAAEARRLAEVKRREERATKAVNWGVLAALLVALPLQIRAFWTPDRPWEVVVPFVLEGLAWVFIRQAEAAIAARRMVWHYLVGVFACSLFAATVNVLDGFLHTEIGPIFGVVGGVCSLAGPGIKVIHEFGARDKQAKATRAERKLAAAQARQAEAEAKAREVELDHKRKTEAERRQEQRALTEAKQAAEAQRLTDQDERRKQTYPQVWKRYEAILAVHPLGSISRDRAWADAQRAAAHSEVWDRYTMLVTAAPAGLRPADLWPVAWRSVYALPVGQTPQTLRAELAARAAVDEVLAEADYTSERAAVEDLLADLFGDDGDDPRSTRKGGRGGPSGGPTTLVGKGKGGPRSDDDRPLEEADLDKVRGLAEELGDAARLSASNVRKRVGCRPAYAIRLRDAVKAEWGIA